MSKRWLGATVVAFLCGAAGTAVAVSTRHFTLDSAEDLAAGEMDGTAVYSDGSVRVGAQVRRIALPDVSVAYCMARAKGGTTFIGTGNDGKVFALRGGTLQPFAETGQLLVASLALGPDGTLYAGTLPEGRIYAIDAQGKATELARPEGAEHIWALTWDAKRGRLLAGTGPEGKIFSIDPKGRVETFYDADAGHIMALALGDDGAVYAGTSDEALVLKLTGPGKADVVGDFPGNEVTALDVRGGVLAVAANEFPKPPNVSGSSKKSGRAPPRPEPGKGRLFRVGPDGRAEKLIENDDGHFAAVQIAPDGAIFVGVGNDGHVLRVTPDRKSAVWLDVDERQVLALDLVGPDPLLLTGDTGAVYRVVEGPAEAPRWTSKVLDAEFQARWGALRWRGDGPVAMQTRSGNTAEPDATWSDWSSPLSSPGPVRSPAARFLQVRARLGNAKAVLRAVQAYYLPQNQRPVVTDVAVRSPSADEDEPDALPSPSSVYTLTWDVDNPDGDELRFRLRFRGEGQDVWRDMLREHQILTSRKYAWGTSGVPDGWYVVEVRAADELANPAPLTLGSAATSEPFLVDNHAPRIEQLAGRGRTVTGRAVDSVGPIARLEYAVDGKRFHMFFPRDGLLDSRQEDFALELPPELEKGSHIVAIRATDAGGNPVTAEITVVLP